MLLSCRYCLARAGSLWATAGTRSKNSLMTLLFASARRTAVTRRRHPLYTRGRHTRQAPLHKDRLTSLLCIPWFFWRSIPWCDHRCTFYLIFRKQNFKFFPLSLEFTIFFEWSYRSVNHLLSVCRRVVTPGRIKQTVVRRSSDALTTVLSGVLLARTKWPLFLVSRFEQKSSSWVIVLVLSSNGTAA